ncbi:hypothetical protein J5U23_01685 [Saccharolobus shibatae B12]|uniref:Uncharacterized protein n=1 Tax=Saccharolobus shibatae (strain ATCC 51178 / DSM 5389 / JCM 8931 / NBRC 15437 / B12) TaxID=523848 RepID=A0A8F5GTH7_SACSH|nr:hypothetical protein J5U23_01685 [Saccharolobus shibatae B12]
MVFWHKFHFLSIPSRIIQDAERSFNWYLDILSIPSRIIRLDTGSSVLAKTKLSIPSRIILSNS